MSAPDNATPPAPNLGTVEDALRTWRCAKGVDHSAHTACGCFSTPPALSLADEIMRAKWHVNLDSHPWDISASVNGRYVWVADACDDDVAEAIVAEHNATLRATESDEAKRNAAIAAVVDETIRAAREDTRCVINIGVHELWARKVCLALATEAEARLKGER